MGEKNLQSILNIAEAKERDAAQIFVKARKVFESDQAKLDELRGFQDEYHQAESRVSHSASHFHAKRQFLFQLGKVIDHQEEQLNITQNSMNIEEQSWKGFRVKRKSIEVLADIRARQFAAEGQRLEQKELDDMAQRCRSPFGKSGALEKIEGSKL